MAVAEWPAAPRARQTAAEKCAYRAKKETKRARLKNGSFSCPFMSVGIAVVAVDEV